MVFNDDCLVPLQSGLQAITPALAGALDKIERGARQSMEENMAKLQAMQTKDLKPLLGHVEKEEPSEDFVEKPVEEGNDKNAPGEKNITEILKEEQKAASGR